jgi:hypothetical protein
LGDLFGDADDISSDEEKEKKDGDDPVTRGDDDEDVSVFSVIFFVMFVVQSFP